MKKIFYFFFSAFVLSLLIIGASLSASAETITGYCGEGENRKSVSYSYNTDSEVVTISGQGAMENGDETYSIFLGGSIKTVIIEKGVTSIGNYTFYNCENLTKVTIPDSVTSIGDHAFRNTGLRSVTIPKSVTTIGDFAFEFCYKMETLVLSEGIISIGAYAFSECNYLTTVTIPNSVTTIGDSAFVNCYNVKEFKVGNELETIGASAFSGCSYIKSFSLGENVKSIGDRAFYFCDSLTDLRYCGTQEEWNMINFGKDWEPTTSYNWNTVPVDYTLSFHTWKENQIVTRPTCQLTGEATYMCTVCKQSKTEVLPKSSTHAYGNWEEYDSKQHKRVCECGEIQYANHSFSNNQDAECNKCNFMRAVETSESNTATTSDPFDSKPSNGQTVSASEKLLNCNSTLSPNTGWILLISLISICLQKRKRYN